jgi:signal transduction histidine kinase
MFNISDLSFRYKIPLRSTALVLVTAVPLTISMILHRYNDLKEDMVVEATEMSRLLVHNLAAPMVQDDVWHAYETIKSPFPPSGRVPLEDDLPELAMAMVLDTRHQIYVSNDPARYPVLAEPARLGPELGMLQSAVARFRGTDPQVFENPDSGHIYMIAPILADGVRVGTLVLGYSSAAFLPHFWEIAGQSALVTLLILAVLLPITSFWAHRMAIPLVQLAKCMGKIGPSIPNDLECVLYESKDEIGQVDKAFRRMFNELRKKEHLEKGMAASERLAAVGRLSAGIAHEINNPLGGMLNAINTFKRHGDTDPVTAKTMSLLERGLLQIRDTVGALLVEAKLENNKPLTWQDIEDMHTLVQGKAKKKAVHFDWRNDMDKANALPLPSTLVRQVTINLLLNAIQAVEEHGHVDCHIHADDENLFILVRNDGRHIPPEQMEHLFEPFASQSETGHGLGLWVTYQAVRQMDGGISVESEPGETCFTVALPLAKPL